jgi:uncharacterized protein involved in exopolysaccharide biosynthesis
MNEANRDRAPTLAERWQALRRRGGPALVTGLIVLVLAVATALLWPASYRSSGTVLIEQQELPADLVQSTITSYADQRIQVISQRVMTTDNLLRIVQRYDLYPRLRKNQPREVVLERIRKDIHLQMISADVMDPRQGRATKANIAFTVSYDSQSPELAARVANELVSLYLDENVKSRKQISADAETFLDGEANKLDLTIAGLEKSLARFKDQHLNALPDHALLNRETLIRTDDELRDIDTQLRALDQESTYLDAQLAQISPSSQVYTATGERVLSPADKLKYLRTEEARLSGVYSEDHPDVLRIKREIAGLEAQIGQTDTSNDLQRQLQDAQTKLAQLRERYSEDYPDVVRLKQQIDSLSKTIKSFPSSTHDAAGAAAAAHPDNPAFIQIKAQREANEAQRQALKSKRVSIEAKLAELEGALAAAPAVERDYDALARELEGEQIKYREVRQKQMGAKLAENLEDEQKGEHFTLIDPPLAPEQPQSPNRWLLVGFGFFLALTSAIGAVFVLEGTDSSVRNRRDLHALLQVPPLAILPRIDTLADVASRRRRGRFVLFGTAGGVVTALVLVHLLYRHLDVLWAVATRKLGG